MAGEVKSAQITISEHWHDHVHHKTVGKAPRWDRELGVVCACGEVLGWPDPEHKETLSQYTKRIAQEPIAAASAPGRVKGAFGTYGRSEPEDGEPARVLPGGDNAPEPGDYPDPEVQEPPVDWGSPDAEPDNAEQSTWATAEPPDDEPEPEELVVEPGPDEAQAAPWGAAPTDGPPPWEGVDDQPEHAVGDQVEVAGTTFTKVSEDPFPPPEGEDDDTPLTPEEVARIHREAEENHQRRMTAPIGDLVPYAGIPIMPGEAQVLDPLSGRLAPLDPTLPYTPADVELKIVEILRQLENSELFLRQQLARLHQATHNHDFRYNLALAQSDQRAADQRKAEAWLATEKERHEMTEAEMLVRALRDSQHNLRAQLSGFQSVARSLAVSMVNALDGRDKPHDRALRDQLPPEPSPWDR